MITYLNPAPWCLWIIDRNQAQSRLDLSGADLSFADLSGADLRGANLRVTSLRYTDLRVANLRDANLSNAAASNLRPESIGLPESDGEVARMVAARILDNPSGLDMGYWHTCETTHCLAGWAVHLSGAAGYALEAVTSPSVAGCILMPEASHLFFSSNTEAIKWAKRTVGGAAEKE